jgi:hypothetical protein
MNVIVLGGSANGNRPRNANLNFALELVEDGLSVFPARKTALGELVSYCRPSDRCYYGSSVDPADIRRYWTRWPNAMPAVAPGHALPTDELKWRLLAFRVHPSTNKRQRYGMTALRWVGNYSDERRKRGGDRVELPPTATIEHRDGTLDLLFLSSYTAATVKDWEPGVDVIGLPTPELGLTGAILFPPDGGMRWSNDARIADLPEYFDDSIPRAADQDVEPWGVLSHFEDRGRRRMRLKPNDAGVRIGPERWFRHGVGQLINDVTGLDLDGIRPEMKEDG